MTIHRFVLTALIAALPLTSFAATDAETFANLKAAGAPSQIQEIVTISLASGDITCVQTRDGLTAQVKSTKCDETPNQEYLNGKMNR